MAARRRTRELGQNFLRDPNILGVIERASELSAREDVVLEVGGGEGVLSAHLAARVRWLHVVEVDRRLRDALQGRIGALGNVTVWWGDALRLDLAAFEPAPTKLVANLPYGIAAALVLRTLEQLESISMWVVMVQREVGERLAAAPGSGAYGASSVLAQLAGDVKVLRVVPRTVFAPVPNVDSVLIRIVRTGRAPTPQVRRLVAGAFAHRRKALARSLALAGVQRSREVAHVAREAAHVSRIGDAADAEAVAAERSRDEVRAALVRLGHPADVRAERLAPHEFVALARELGL